MAELKCLSTDSERKNGYGGGNNVPLVLMGQNQRACYAVDSHPGDSRIGIAGEISPTLTVKIAKASSDGPLVLMEER